MSLKRNIFANYTCQVYTSAIGIIIVPMYIRYMGPEAYGLVGFFAMLQAWFSLLDMGVTPTIARETARFNGGKVDALSFVRLVRLLEGIFFLVAFCGCSILIACSNVIAETWLHANQLAESDIKVVLQLMAVIIGLRWMSSFYRSVINGAERLVLLSSFNLIIATGRFVLVLPFIIYISNSPVSYFTFQLCVAIVEMFGMLYIANKLLPNIVIKGSQRWHWASLKPVIKFSMSIAFTSGMWVLILQTDKLVLSKILSLGDFGYFSVAVLVASAIMFISNPISGAIVPRMAKLHAEGKSESLIEVYRSATKLVAVITIPISLIMVLFPNEILWAWTGDLELVKNAAPILRLYAAGYGFLSVSAFPYYIQYATGEMKLHVIGNVFFVIFFIPIVVWSGLKYQMIGVGWSWLSINVIYFFIWTYVVHERFVPGIHIKWLIKDIIQPATFVLIVGLLGLNFINWTLDRKVLALEICTLGVVLILVGYVSANFKKIKTLLV